MDWLWKLLTFVFCREPEQIAISGALLPESDLLQLEHRLKKRPGNLRARYKVLGYMAQHRVQLPELAPRRVEHIIWFIETHPEDKIVGSPFCHVMAEEPGFDQVLKTWEKTLTTSADNPAVIMNASRFFSLQDAKRARELLERGARLQPSSAEWLQEIGTDLLRAVNVARMEECRQGAHRELPENLKSVSQEALRYFRRALDIVNDVESRFRLLVHCAQAALEAGLRTEAIRYAEQVLEVAPRCTGDRHQADMVHNALIVRGRSRVDAGDFEAASGDLERAGKQGSLKAAVLCSFGPDFYLASLLLDAGRREAVLSYLEQCQSFWHPNRIARWRASIESGKRPSMFTGFDPNEPKDEHGPYWFMKLLKDR